MHRLHELESKFIFSQHLGWKKDKDSKLKYRTFGLYGHIIDYLIYLVLISGAPIISILKLGLDIWLWLPTLLIAIFVLFYVQYCECKLKIHLEKIPIESKSKNS